jgi:hypothetical protein
MKISIFARAFLVLMVFGALVTLAFNASATVVEYPPSAEKSDHAEQIIWGAAMQAQPCMHDSVRVQLLKGDRDADHIIAVTVALCGGQVRSLIKDYFKRPDLLPMAEQYLHDCTLEYLMEVPGVKIKEKPPG